MDPVVMCSCHGLYVQLEVERTPLVTPHPPLSVLLYSKRCIPMPAKNAARGRGIANMRSCCGSEVHEPSEESKIPSFEYSTRSRTMFLVYNCFCMIFDIALVVSL
jgi:hypothetical protein